ncbi:MAG TPA: A/G-specific adenine glycosylase [Casimicrobiaceae bacterium]|nr:A/G-specific adenine glycosylase [Casimicrobiaceae bacterium]
MARDTQSFASRVVAWQREHGRHDLPWQRTRDPYRIWLSEIMLQQTQVGVVVPYYERFVAAFPDVRSLAAAPIERVLERWSGLGYYRRAHHLHAAARAIIDRHGGEFPRDATTLAQLPGIGRSTAAAIAAFAFDERGAILDGNVKRVLSRHCGIAVPEKKLWDVAERLLPESDIQSYTQGMMDLGATVCTRTPACLLCPVNEDCVARHEGRIDELPGLRPMRELPKREIRVLVIEQRGEWMFERRPPTGVWSGLLSFPEIAVGDDVAAAVRERCCAEPMTSVALSPIVHGFTHFTLTLRPQRVVIDASQIPESGGQHVWMTRAAALEAALPAPIKRLVASLEV